MSVTEQRYQAVLAVLSEGRTISEVGLQWSDKLLQFWVGNELLKTVARTSTGEIRSQACRWHRDEDEESPRVRHINRRSCVTYQPLPYTPTLAVLNLNRV
jgi:hypothetical protein